MKDEPFEALLLLGRIYGENATGKDIFFLAGWRCVVAGRQGSSGNNFKFEIWDFKFCP